MKLLTIILAALSTAPVKPTDGEFPSILLERVAFGSCNKQTKQQPLWEVVERKDPQLWLWTGDAVYSTNRTLPGLRHAFDTQQRVPEYAQMVRKPGRIVDGVWDDHDLGVNDGGNDVPNRPERQAEYISFIRQGQGQGQGQDQGSRAEDRDVEGDDDAEARTNPESARHDWQEGRQGLYRSLSFGEASSGRQVKVILLDTRSHRDVHAIPSSGSYLAWIPLLGPLMPLVASALRWFSIDMMPSITAAHRGDMLGEEQWEWLERELEPDPASHAPAFTVIVSSVQVLSSASVFESWMHFPVSKRRLLELLARKQPRGVVFLSGDVHFGELSLHPHPDSTESSEQPATAASATGPSDHTMIDGNERHSPEPAGRLYEASCGELVEVTSSGMTHTCTTSPKTRFLCPVVTSHFSTHRPFAEALYTGLNFGTLEFDWGAPGASEPGGNGGNGGAVMTASVVGSDGAAVFGVRRRSCAYAPVAHAARTAASGPATEL